MCGRYARRSDKQRIAEWFHAEQHGAGLGAEEFAVPDSDYNIAPTTYQPIVRESRETGRRKLVLARWGLVPYFTKDLKDLKAMSTINARAESITTAGMWRQPVRKRRCLVPADAFYEWPKDANAPRQPYAIEMKDGAPFAFAGLWDAWKDAEGKWLQSFAIVTTEANELMAKIHPRMPVILREKDYERWLDREETERPPLDLLRPFDADALEMHEANLKVNNARNNGPELLRKAREMAENGLLPL
jgi:putative SOS response-associated peptidase YedK